MTEGLWQRVRALAYSTLIILTWVSILQAQGETVPSSEHGVDIFKWGITQGGLALVTLVILWSYRKDSLEWIRIERERSDILADMNNKLIAVIVANTEAMTANAETTRQLIQEIRRGGRRG